MKRDTDIMGCSFCLPSTTTAFVFEPEEFVA